MTVSGELPAGIDRCSPSGQVTVTPVPAGLWVRIAGGPAVELSDPGFAVPPAPDQLAVVVGRPGEPPPPVPGLAAVIGALPPTLRRRTVLVPYGPQPPAAAPIAQQLADRLAATVRATHGLPGYAADGSLRFVLVDDAGQATWQPFVTQSVYHPGAQPPTPWAWRPPLPDLPQAGPSTFGLAEGWVVDPVPSGLVVRPAAAALDPALIRRAADARNVDLVVTAAYPARDNVPVPVLYAIGQLARALPPAVQDRLRILITDQVDPPELVGLAGALRLPIRRLSEGGTSPIDPVHGVAAGAGHAEGRPDSVGRLHASTVPAVAGRPAGSASAAPATPSVHPSPSTSDDTGGSDEPESEPTDVAAGSVLSQEAPRSGPAAAGPPPMAAPGEPPAPIGSPPVAVAPVVVAPVAAAPVAGAQPGPTVSTTPATGAPVGRSQPPGPPVSPAPVAAPPVGAGPGPVPVTQDRAGGTDQWWHEGSTAAERQQFRHSIGWRYDSASRYVTRMLSERPNLRAAAAGDGGVATELAAVHVFAAGDHTGQVEPLRSASVARPDRAFLSCVVGGLRRLPTLTGLVLRGGPDDPAAAEAYQLGSDVVEPGLLLAVADPDADLPGGIEVLIWSSMARRLDGLVDGPACAQVVFLPGTVFRVLDIDRTGTVHRMLLAEVPQTWRDHADADRDRRVLDRLRGSVQARAAQAAAAAAEPSGDHRWTGLAALPGLVPAEPLRGAA